MSYSSLIASGSWLPERVMSNEEVSHLVESSDRWIRERTGIQQRHIAAADESTCDMAEKASRRALQAAGMDATDLDSIIVATTTPDMIFPSTACLLQHRLGAPGTTAFDVQAVCSGFVYALSIADKFLRCDAGENILVVGSDCLSRILNWKDRGTCVLFGDGAGAVVLKRSDKPGVIYSRLGADGSHQGLLDTPGGPGRAVRSDEPPPFLRMQGPAVFKLAVHTMVKSYRDGLEQAELQPDDIDWLIPHQANQRIIRKFCEQTDFPPERVIDTVPHHGNTSAASIPLALDHACRQGKLLPGQSLFLMGFGAGFTWGSVILRLPETGITGGSWETST